MDWRAPRGGSGTADVAGMLRRAEAHIGGPPLSGTRFLNDARAMLAQTREIEAAVYGVPTMLYVGFQSAGRLEDEVAVYRDLVNGGTRVVGFGRGAPRQDIPGLRWVELGDDDATALINQWFLVASEPQPVAFAGFDTSPEPLRDTGAAGLRGRTWDGFVSHDPRLVAGIIAHLELAQGAHPPPPTAR